MYQYIKLPISSNTQKALVIKLDEIFAFKLQNVYDFAEIKYTDDLELVIFHGNAVGDGADIGQDIYTVRGKQVMPIYEFLMKHFEVFDFSE